MSDNTTAAIIFVLAVGLSSIYWSWACYFLATEKDRQATGWAIMGAIIGPLAFLPLACAPDLTEYAPD